MQWQQSSLVLHLPARERNKHIKYIPYNREKYHKIHLESKINCLQTRFVLNQADFHFIITYRGVDKSLARPD